MRQSRRFRDFQIADATTAIDRTARPWSWDSGIRPVGGRVRDRQVKPVPAETRPIDQVSATLVESREGRIAGRAAAAHGGVG
jgi:hypothetical protein